MHKGQVTALFTLHPFRIVPLIFLIIFIIVYLHYPINVNSQEVSDYEISTLEQQLKEIEAKIIPIDNELNVLIPEYDKITDEISKLKLELRESKSIFSKFVNIIKLKERRLGYLLTQAQEIDNKIVQLQKRRDPLVKEYIRVADRLIDKTGQRIVALMDIMLKSDTSVSSNQIAYLWQLADRTTTAKNKYIPTSSAQKEIKLFLPPIGNDPEKLRQGAKIVKNIASETRIKLQSKKRRIKELESRRLSFEQMIERWKEIQRMNEENESRSVESGTANIPTGFNEYDIRKKIDKINEEINKLLIEVRELENNALNLENQSKILEQRASQLEKGK